jgi:putative PIN family toxin of toxin-antitoxin system
LRVVLDTNVLVASIFWTDGNPSKIVNHAIEGKITNHVSLEILNELRRVLRLKFREPEDKIEHQIKTILDYSVIVSPEVSVDIIKGDPSDDRIIECAVACDADMIITGDAHLLDLKSYKGIAMISPSDFLRRKN